eukprot:301504-Pyramimonas_sp.AAC.1
MFGLPLPIGTFLFTFRTAPKEDKALANDAAHIRRLGFYLRARAAATLELPVPGADLAALQLPGASAQPLQTLNIPCFADDEVQNATGQVSQRA